MPRVTGRRGALPRQHGSPKDSEDALRRGTAGTVELRAIIAADGRTKDISILSGEPEFSHPAVLAIRKWRFHPQVKNGQHLETTYRIQVRFNPELREANSSVELESPQPDPVRLSSIPRVPEDSGETVHRSSESGVTPPKATYQPEPEFSEVSRKAREHGNVNIALVVGSDGLPRDLRVICSSIPNSNENAIEAVKQWKFAPATKDGRPVSVRIAVEISFKRYN